MVWQVVEKPTNSIINEYFFEEDAQKIVDFQNKNKVWKNNGTTISLFKIQSKISVAKSLS